MSESESKSSPRVRAPFRTLALLVAAALLLTLMLFSPRRAGLGQRAAPLRGPVLLDEPVVHLYK